MIPQIQPWIDKSELFELTKVIKSTYITENYFTKKFEDKISKLTNSKYAVAMSNGTVAQYAALIALGIKKNDEVIIPNITFISTANAVIMAGAKPVLCEIYKDDLCIDYSKIEKLITKRTKMIIPVHLYGLTSDMFEINKIAKKYKLKVFEDAAQGMGVFFKKNHVGTIGDIGMISFYGNKTITTGQGGILLTNKKTLYQKLIKLKNHGRIKQGTFIHDDIGFNFAFTDLQAALGVSQLKKLKKIINKKKSIKNKYDNHLLKVNEIKNIKIPKNCKPVFWFTSYLFEDSENLSKYLFKAGIQTRKFFYPLHMQPCYKKKKIVKNLNSNFNISEEVYSSGLSLPSSYNLTDKQQKYIISKIINYYENRN